VAGVEPGEQSQGGGAGHTMDLMPAGREVGTTGRASPTAQAGRAGRLSALRGTGGRGGGGRYETATLSMIYKIKGFRNVWTALKNMNVVASKKCWNCGLGGWDLAAQYIPSPKAYNANGNTHPGTPHGE